LVKIYYSRVTIIQW